MDSHAIEQTAADWVTRRDAEDWNAADEEALTRWLDESVAHEVSFLRVQSVWRQADRLQALGAGVPAGHLPEPGQWTVSPFMKPAPPAAEASPMLRRSVAAAASIVVLVGAAAGYLYFHNLNAYQTRLGHIEAVPLDDGSQAILNTDSRIRVSLDDQERRIDLKRGEVYFDVAKDPARPFVVQMEGQRIVAVGTQFSVRRIGDEIRVIVTEGRVRVEAQQPALLGAGGIARGTTANLTVTQETVARAEDYLAWRQGYVVFTETPLVEAVAEFNRYNSQQLVISDPALNELPVGGTVRANNMKAFVRILEHAFQVQATAQGNRILLSRAARGD